MRHYTYILPTILLIICSSCTKTDQPSDANAAKIDALFSPWNTPNSPGAAVAVIKDGKVIFKKGYGMANLEYNIPIEPSSIFHIASESKQYTDFCIVLLAQQGKLSLDDDIRKYLPEVPDFGKKITIRQLIYHTSGLRDQWQLLAISGTRLDDVIQQEHVLKLVSRQRELNFEPGARNLYCNTGYTILGEIVKKVSGQSLRKFADSAIFKPLGMHHTHFHDNYTEIVKGRTYSYDSLPDGLVNSILSYSTVGATSLFTTIEDEAKWLNNYETAQVGGTAAITQMYEQGVLNDGTKLHYAFGINIDHYKGWKRIGHGGADAGYRTYAVRFPEAKLGIIVFSNLGNFNTYDLAHKIADLYLEDRSEKKDSVKEVNVDKAIFRSYAGDYSSDEGATCSVLDSNRLYIKFWQTEAMTPLSDSTFSLWDGAATIHFAKPASGKSTSFTLKESNNITTFKRSNPPVLSKASMDTYTGTYESGELETRYHIITVNNELILRHQKYPDVPLTPVAEDQFSCPHWWMRNIIFSRDEKGATAAFEINNDRVLHLKFKKHSTTE